MVKSNMIQDNIVQSDMIQSNRARNNRSITAEQTVRPRIWQAALYVRLSREDGDKEESDSVVNQRELLTQFVSLEEDIAIQDVYIDDGWSGTSFDRPEFKRMLSAITGHIVDCVIVKDLSRFGRNYIDAGRYIEVLFPAGDIRFISINDGLDSVKNPQTMNNILVPFKNLINDEYCRDISNKVRSSLDMKRKQGKHIGSFACYGYIKDPADHNHIVPDPEAAEVVRQIFDWYIAGSSIIGIAKKLNALGIPNPTLHKQQLGYNYRHTSGQKNDGLWPDSSVKHVLSNRMYIGDLVQGVNKTKSYKVQRAQRQMRDKWIIVEGTHEAIISKNDYAMVQELLKRRTRTSPGKQQVHMLSGFVKCADCGKAMNRKVIVQPYRTYYYYVCSTYKKMDKTACTKHTLREDRLEAAVLKTIQTQVALAVDVRRAIEGINKSDTVNRKAGSLRGLLEKTEREAERIENLVLELYPDWKSGIISKDEYIKLKSRLEKQLEDTRIRLEELKIKIKEAERGQGIQNEFIRNFIRFQNIHELTREVIAALIEQIYVYENGDIEIDFKYCDPYRAAIEYIESNRELVSENQKAALHTA